MKIKTILFINKMAIVFATVVVIFALFIFPMACIPFGVGLSFFVYSYYHFKKYHTKNGD